MLPFQITNFALTFSNFQEYYQKKHGRDALLKIHQKVGDSNGFAKLCGASITQLRPPIAHDFRLITSNLFIMGSVEKITLAALIALSLWNARVNGVYNFASEDEIEIIFRNILDQSRLTHF